MLSIRSGIVSDVALLRTLIQEFATFERLPVAITEEQLRQDGFGAQPKFRILIAECDGQVAGYALRLLFVVPRPRHSPGRPVCPTVTSWQECGTGFVGACCEDG